jgi:hypothetical protein
MRTWLRNYAWGETRQRRPTASVVIIAVFILYLWVMAILPGAAFFNFAWGERYPSGECPPEPYDHWCGYPGYDCPEDYGWTVEEVCQ